MYKIETFWGWLVLGIYMLKFVGKRKWGKAFMRIDSFFLKDKRIFSGVNKR